MEIIKIVWGFLKNARYLRGMTRKSVVTVVSVAHPFGDYYVIALKPTTGLTWNAGEHAMFRLPQFQELKKEFRIFSIASVQNEGLILLGMRTGKATSNFKQALLSLKPGDPVSITGPFGWFRLRDDRTPVVLFAGGVGITPVRSLVKELADSQTRPICIVYASGDFYLFEDEIQAVADSNPMMTLYKTKTPDDTQAQMEQLAVRYGNNAYYYLAASPRVLDSVAKLLKSKGVSSKRLIDDTLRGY